MRARLQESLSIILFMAQDSQSTTSPFTINIPFALKDSVVLPAPQVPEDEEVPTEVYEKARAGDYRGAAETCVSKLGQLDPDLGPTRRAHLTEFLAMCNFKAAFQAEDRETFEQRMRAASEFHQQSAGLFERAVKSGHSTRAAAKALFAEFWTEHDFAKRRVAIGKCLELSGEASRVFQKQGDQRLLAESHLDLLTYLREACDLTTESRSLENSFQEALRYGRNAIIEFEFLGHEEGLIEALHFTIWLLVVVAQVVLVPSEFQAQAKEARDLESKLRRLSDKTGALRTRILAKQAAGDLAFNLDGNVTQAGELYTEALASAIETKDSLLLGRLSWSLSRVGFWRGSSMDELEKRRDLLGDGLDFATHAIKNFSVSLPTTDLAVAHASAAELHIELANLVETEVLGKKGQLKQAIQAATIGINYENGTWAWSQAAHALAKALYFLAKLEDGEQKAQLLMRALPIREETVRVADLLLPQFWSPIVMRSYLALIKSELAVLQEDQSTKASLLGQAVRDMEECLELGSKWATGPNFLHRLAQYGEWYGEILFQLHTLTGDLATALRAVKAYDVAISYLAGSKQHGTMAPLWWKVARVYDHTSDFKNAAHAFKKAAEEYNGGAREIPGSASAFDDFAQYMEAWVEIETARLNHAGEEYDLASQHYANAATKLRSSTTWNFLSQLCTARSRLEEGESLSSEEKHNGAIRSFRDAVAIFREAKDDLEKRLRGTVETREQQELKEWLLVARQREVYSRGRIELEEARLLDKKGENAESAEKYRGASENLRTLLVDIATVQDRQELGTLIQFCDAWAKMKEAESKSSPELYSEASDSFLEATRTASREQFRLLAFASASICRALEAGAKFRLTRDPQLYSDIKNQLQAAADHYRQAGFEKTERWTRATQRLFDALIFLSDAEIQRDPEKKTGLYHLAEKHLELAARLYGEAGFPKMKEEALEHLGRVREEKNVLLAPLEALSQVPFASGASLGSVTLGRGQPLGVERFGEAYVVGDMSIPQRELPVGTSASLELDIANVGNTAATLVKLQNIVPEGLEFDSQRTSFRIEDNSIPLEGRRLEHLKTHQVKIAIKTPRKGVFELRPRLFFVDEGGNYKSYQFPPATLTVLELGKQVLTPLSAQIVPPNISLPMEFRFETDRAREVFQFLVKEFLSDYMSKRIYTEKAGWRSLMGLVKEMKIPRSALYGPGGRDGPILSELERRGLIETRIFPKERGRGGAIKKVRVAYDNAIVKRIIEQTVMENK